MYLKRTTHTGTFEYHKKLRNSSLPSITRPLQWRTASIFPCFLIMIITFSKGDMASLFYN